MSFQINGLDPKPFLPLYGKTDAELAELHITRHRVDAFGAYPDRVTLQPMQIGETALLLNYEHLPVDSPYRSRHAIYVQEGADAPFTSENTVPPLLTAKPMALRGIDTAGCIQDADLVQGDAVEATITRMFANPDIAYIHAHFAARGCFAARIDRS